MGWIRQKWRAVRWPTTSCWRPAMYSARPSRPETTCASTWRSLVRRACSPCSRRHSSVHDELGADEQRMNTPFSVYFVPLWQMRRPGVENMSPRFFVLIASLTLPTALAKAETTTRTFFNPAVFGKPVALCMSDRASCGKPAADAWCRDNGYGEALTFERMRTVDKSLVFRQIKCINREATVAAAAGEMKTATP